MLAINEHRLSMATIQLPEGGFCGFVDASGCYIGFRDERELHIHIQSKMALEHFDKIADYVLQSDHQQFLVDCHPIANLYYKNWQPEKKVLVNTYIEKNL